MISFVILLCLLLNGFYYDSKYTKYINIVFYSLLITFLYYNEILIVPVNQRL